MLAMRKATDPIYGYDITDYFERRPLLLKYSKTLRFVNRA